MTQQAPTHSSRQTQTNPGQSYRSRKAQWLAALGANKNASRSTSTALLQLSKLADAALRELWQQVNWDVDCALLAVGGFGRSELFPYSDIDVLILLAPGQKADTRPQLQACIEQFIGSCWDAGLEIASSVGNSSDCLLEAAKDTSVQTALLEARWLAGSHSLFADFQTAFAVAMDAHAFFVAKTLELEQRHHKYEDTPYALEPNCKESPGGLRDLHTVLWLAKAARLGSNWNALAKAGLASAFEVQQIKRNEALLRLVRMQLHLLSGRREDRLVFDLQTSVAAALGYAAGPSQSSPMHPSERLMRRYYKATKAVLQLSQILLLNIEERLHPQQYPQGQLRALDEDFLDKAGMLEVASDDLYQRKPEAILRTFLVYQSDFSLKGLSARTLRALYNARHLMGSRFRHDPANHATFRRIMLHPSGQTHALRLMNQTSVLGHYLWAFGHIVGQMQHDLFHVYTVDQHILMVLRNMRRFFIVEHAHEYPFCSQLAGDFDQPWVLYLAALFHDIAKGRGGDHSILGAQEVRRFCQRHGIAGKDAELIEFLVREHLIMSQIAQKSDISNPDVIASFAKRVGNERALTALYLLTVADIRGTSPKVWNSWKGKLLEDLYRATSRALGGHRPDVHAQVQERQREALIELARLAQPFASHKALWATLDVGYFMRHDASEMSWHARILSRHLGSAKPIVRARLWSAQDNSLQVMVYSRDQADLFARICGFFDRCKFSILDARIHTTQDGFALDTFQVVALHPGEYYRELIHMIEVDLAHAIASQLELPAPSQGRVSRRVRSFPVTPRVSLKPDEKGQRWLLNVSASDQAGLLYRIALVLARHKVDLKLAKINTLGERVEDTFLIESTALQHNREKIQIETELLAMLNQGG